MKLNNFEQMTVLITGGTKGIGLATTECFAKAGAKVYATYLWGDNVPELEQRFSDWDNKPIFIQADVSSEEDTKELMDVIEPRGTGIDVFISNAAFAPQFKENYKYKELITSIEHNVWPLVSYLDNIKSHFKSHPKYVVVTTSEGHRTFHVKNYDYVAISKTMLETLTSYINCRENIKINCVSPGMVDTEAFELVFGQPFQDFVKKHRPELMIKTEEVANVMLALCSGLMDAVSGQVIRVDNGRMFDDNAIKWHDIFQQHFVEKEV